MQTKSCFAEVGFLVSCFRQMFSHSTYLFAFVYYFTTFFLPFPEVYFGFLTVCTIIYKILSDELETIWIVLTGLSLSKTKHKAFQVLSWLLLLLTGIVLTICYIKCIFTNSQNNFLTVKPS